MLVVSTVNSCGPLPLPSFARRRSTEVHSLVISASLTKRPFRTSMFFTRPMSLLCTCRRCPIGAAKRCCRRNRSRAACIQSASLTASASLATMSCTRTCASVTRNASSASATKFAINISAIMKLWSVSVRRVQRRMALIENTGEAFRQRPSSLPELLLSAAQVCRLQLPYRPQGAHGGRAWCRDVHS